jgi:hypothetical protein
MNNTHSEANKFTPKSSKIDCHLLIPIDSPQPLHLLCEHFIEEKISLQTINKIVDDQWL